MGIVDSMNQQMAESLARQKARELQGEEARKTDAMRRHQYAVARESMLGDFSSFPILPAMSA